MKKLAITFLSISFIALSCRNAHKTSEIKEHEVLAENIVEMNADQYKMADIQLGSVELKNMNSTLKVNGIVTVSPQNLASVCAPLGGFVKHTNLVQGSAVKKGQTLAIIENPEFIELQRNYLESYSKLEYAEANYKRHQELYKDEVYSKENIQQVTSDYKGLKAQVNAYIQKLSMIGIEASKLNENNISGIVPVVSPINGYIKLVNINLGKFVSPTDVMFEIVNTADLTLELTLFEKDINKINIGQKLWFLLSNNEIKSFKATVTQVGKTIAADKTVKVFANINDFSEKIIPGMYVNARIETSSNTVTAVQTQSLVRFDEKDFIFVYEKSKKEGSKDVTEFKMVEVKKGTSDGGFTEIILPENFDIKNTKVVTKGAYTLLAAKKNAGDMAC